MEAILINVLPTLNVGETLSAAHARAEAILAESISRCFEYGSTILQLWHVFAGILAIAFCGLRRDEPNKPCLHCNHVSSGLPSR